MAEQCKRFLVTGRVQGVFFRASTQREAHRLGLTGHAINLPDGRVEVLACGTESDLAGLENWLWRGSRAASVSEVRSEPVECETPPSGFRTG